MGEKRSHAARPLGTNAKQIVSSLYQLEMEKVERLQDATESFLNGKPNEAMPHINAALRTAVFSARLLSLLENGSYAAAFDALMTWAAGEHKRAKGGA